VTRPREVLTALDDLSQCLSVVRILCDWFTEVPGLTSPIINRQCNMMRRNGASDRWPAGLDSFHGSTSCGVLKYNPQFRESFMNLAQMGYEGGFCV